MACIDISVYLCECARGNQFLECFNLEGIEFLLSWAISRGNRYNVKLKMLDVWRMRVEDPQIPQQVETM